MRFIEQNESPNYYDDLIIFATDTLSCKNKFRHCIAIQHGIAFDGTSCYHVSEVTNIKSMLKSMVRAMLKYHRYKNISTLVCVDYNFLNWYRTQVAHIDAECYVIPNFSHIPNGNTKNVKTDNRVSIIFARRLEDYRGTRIFTESIASILETNKLIKVTVAGTGPDENYIKERLSQYENVSFISYASEQSLKIHSEHDIAVVPSLYSEGTSLSLLEAMAAGCAVISTNVGGMTNIILDGFNGLMIRPVAHELQKAIEKLLNETELRVRLAENARKTVEVSFSFEKWKEAWKHVLDEEMKK